MTDLEPFSAGLGTLPADLSAWARGILAHSPEPIFLLDPDGGIVFVNRAPPGFDGSRWPGRSFAEVFPGAAASGFPEAFARVTASGRAEELEIVQAAAGASRRFRIRLCPAPGGGSILFCSESSAAEEAARKSEARLRLFIEHVPAALAMFDTEMRYITASRKWMRDFGYREEDLIGKGHYETFPDMPAHWKEAHRRGLEGESVRAEEDPHRLPDGSVVWNRWEVRPWYGPSGRVGGIVILVENITAEREAREALRRSERLYRAIGESIDYGVWVCAPDGRNIYTSESFLRLVGMTQEECGNFGWGDVLHPDDAERTLAAWKECVRTGGKWDFEHRYRGVDGRWHDVLARGVQVRDDDGEVLCWAGINLDISNLKKTEKSLKEALFRLNSHMENTPLAVVEKDADFRITRWAGAALEMFGWTAEEAFGKRTSDLGIIPEEHLAAVDGIMAGMAAGTNRRNMNANPNRRRDGSIIECEWYNSALYDENGRMVSTLSLVLDVTRRKQLEADLIAAREAAESANRAKSEFLARMSHELRTPMNGAIGMIELALRQGVGGKAKEYLGLAKQSSHALLDIINDLLDLARIEAGRIDLESAPFLPRAVVNEVVGILGAVAGEKGVRLTAEVAPEVPRTLAGDAARLRQVLMNLVGNAVKFTPQGQVTIQAGLAPEQPGGGRVRLAFSVEDTGIGIPPDQLGSVFDSFSRATAATHAKYGGTGLGLSICKQIVSRMGGEILAASRPGAGSTFTFTAEFTVPADGSAEAKRAERRVRRGEEDQLRVLLAEDNPVNRLFAQSVIEEEGHLVTLADDGEAALDALAEGGFDLVLMDVQMPRMDGIEAARRIRAGAVPGCDRNIPIIALTAHAFAEDREQFLSAGMNDYISKPIDLAELDRLLAHWSDRSRGAEAVSRAAPEKPGLERAKKRLADLLSRLPPAKVWGLLDQAMAQMGPAVDRLASLVERGEAREAAGEAHRLRGTWTVVLGTDRMIEISTEIERLAESGATEPALPLVAELRAEVSALDDFLRSQPR